MIISLVSRHERAGKTRASQLIRQKFKFYRASFANDLHIAARAFLPSMADKYQVHPELGVSLKDVNHAIAKALQDLNPEIAVFAMKQSIEVWVGDGKSVVIDDTRRQREFLWLDEIAAKHGTRHHIIEIVPVRHIGTEGIAKPDTWSNGIEPCGHEAWKDRLDRDVILDDYTEAYDRRVVALVDRLLDGGC